MYKEFKLISGFSKRIKYLFYKFFTNKKIHVGIIEANASNDLPDILFGDLDYTGTGEEYTNLLDFPKIYGSLSLINTSLTSLENFPKVSYSVFIHKNEKLEDISLDIKCECLEITENLSKICNVNCNVISLVIDGDICNISKKSIIDSYIICFECTNFDFINNLKGNFNFYEKGGENHIASRFFNNLKNKNEFKVNFYQSLYNMCKEDETDLTYIVWKNAETYMSEKDLNYINSSKNVEKFNL